MDIMIVDWDRLPWGIAAVVAGVIGFAVFYFIGKHKAKKKNWLDQKYDGHE